MSDNAQRLVYARFYHEDSKTFVEDILGITALKTHTREAGTYLAINIPDSRRLRNGSALTALHPPSHLNHFSRAQRTRSASAKRTFARRIHRG